MSASRNNIDESPGDTAERGAITVVSKARKSPELKRVKVQSASEKVTNICTENSYTNWSNLCLPVKKKKPNIAVVLQRGCFSHDGSCSDYVKLPSWKR